MAVEIVKQANRRWEWNIFIDNFFVGYISKFTNSTKVGDQYVKHYTVFAFTGLARDDSVILFSSCTHDNHLNKTGGGLGEAKKWVRDNLSTKEDFMVKTTCAQLNQLEEIFNHG
tara:strand:- start:5674 stop:6015 length:342 start_codon:yes stop_codon:yes gene_type:complete